MNTYDLLQALDIFDETEKLPEGVKDQAELFRLLSNKIDDLAYVKDKLESVEKECKSRSDKFAATKKVASNDVARFKKRAVDIFKSQDGKKFPGSDFTASIVRKKTLKTSRPPEFKDYTDKKMEKFVIASFEYKKEPNAEVYSLLKREGFGDFCGFKFDWNYDLIKTKDFADVAHFCYEQDSSYVKFAPKKG